LCKLLISLLNHFLSLRPFVSPPVGEKLLNYLVWFSFLLNSTLLLFAVEIAEVPRAVPT
jgi:hypothetical protein